MYFRMEAKHAHLVSQHGTCFVSKSPYLKREAQTVFVYESSFTHGVTSAGEDGGRERKRGWVPSHVTAQQSGSIWARGHRDEGLWSVAVCERGWLRVMECFREVRTRL